METQEDINFSPQVELPPGFTFSHEGKWLIKISTEGIKFNREEFPNLDAEGFVHEFINILETHFNIKFEKK